VQRGGDGLKADVCVSGSGAVAMSLALSLAAKGWHVAWARDPQRHPMGAEDVRTYALNARSLDLLTRLRVWPALQAHACPVSRMAIHGDAGGALSFSAWQQCQAELAWIVDAGALERLLGEAIGFSPLIHQVAPLGEDAQQQHAPLLAVCEGKHSAARQALGVHFERQAYGHSGLALRVESDRPHQGVAHQWFRSPDILALLPFNQPREGHGFGVVWSMPQHRADALLAQGPEAIEQALMQAVRDAGPEAAEQMGALRLTAAPAAWPLALGCADRWSGPGWVLVGDAAHQVHPLSGQGLNLGLADVDTLVTVLDDARRQAPWRSPADERVLARYARQRQWPTQAMSALTDTLLNLFADQRSVVKDIRNLGLSLVDRFSPLKTWLATQAMDRPSA
jgi:ubiquinone biosynthesis UbiH/UbiF/VisC/COQ6 family hydroxylase